MAAKSCANGTLVAFLLIFLFQNAAATLKCYTCTATEAGSDCELNPAVVPGGETNCNKKYCTLRRVEYKSTGKVYSFYRSCEDDPIYVNNIIEDDTYRTYFYACSTPLCNGGTGSSGSGSNSNNGAPAGVTKPPFNENVLHMGASAIAAQKTLIALTAALVAGLWYFNSRP